MEQRTLLQANALYRKCLRLLHLVIGANSNISPNWHQQQRHVASGHVVIDLLMMATLNNLSHLAYEFMNYRESDLFQEELVHFVKSVQTTAANRNRAVDRHMQPTLDDQTRQFLLNAIVLRVHPTASAAA